MLNNYLQATTSDIYYYSYPFDRIKRLYDINVHGSFFTAREAARRMIPDGGGSIVLVSSMSAQVSPQFSYGLMMTYLRHQLIRLQRR